MGTLRKVRLSTADIKYSAVLVRLRELRKRAGLTQAQAAAEIGMKSSGFSAIETGKVPLRVLDLFRLARIYGVSPMYALTGIPEIDELSLENSAMRNAIDDIRAIVDEVRPIDIQRR